jgi:hypothetical protein
MHKGVYRHTEERKAKIRAARQRRKEELGYINSPETRAKIGRAAIGKPKSEETRAKLSAAGKIRQYAPEHLQKFQDAGHAALRGKTGELSASWKGDQASYVTIHQWVVQQKGKPFGCEMCGTTVDRRYNWTSRSGDTLRDTDDWMSVCIPCCRKKYPHEVWNKGKQTGPNLKARGARPGTANKGSFVKGQAAHNKGRMMPSYSGERHPRWKGGLTKIDHKIRSTVAYKQWRMAVLERDHFTCVLCGYVHCKPRDIRADHILPFHQYPEVRFEVSNGRALCVPCDLTHGWQMWREGNHVIDTP